MEQAVDNISGSTFKKHLYNAYKKMGISSRTQLFNTMLAAKTVNSKKGPVPKLQAEGRFRV